MTCKQDELKAWILNSEAGKTWYNKLVSDATKRAYLPTHNSF